MISGVDEGNVDRSGISGFIALDKPGKKDAWGVGIALKGEAG